MTWRERFSTAVAVTVSALVVQRCAVTVIVLTTLGRRGLGPWASLPHGHAALSSLLHAAGLALLLLAVAAMALGLHESTSSLGVLWTKGRARARRRELGRQLAGRLPLRASDAGEVWELARSRTHTTALILLYSGLLCSQASAEVGRYPPGLWWDAPLIVFMVAISAWVAIEAIAAAGHLRAHPDPL